MTEQQDENTAAKGNAPGSPVPEPKSGAGYGNDAEELQKGDAGQTGGEEKSA